MNVNFELYKVFYHAAKNLSFTRAAESLFVTQSSVSQSIKQLENQLDILLFIRNKRNMQLTKEGEMLFFHIAEAFDLIKAGERNIENTKTLGYGEVRIGASDTICRYFLLDYIKRFHADYPNIKINITNQPSMQTLEDIAGGKMDFGIVNLPDNMKGKGVNITEIKGFQEVAITTDAYAEKLPENPSIRDLKNHPLITLTPNTNTRRYLDAFFRGQKETLAPEFELESIDLIVDFVRIGLGVGFVMADAIPKDEKTVRILDLKETLPSRSIGIVTNKNSPLSIPTEHFMNVLIKGR
ncbi:LysR family transcriptional regulator [Desulfoluna limicola]|uniref:LysR family transcriptional regulator n=1 Tax=Desulfoluna limicola TaxID=2810562 RepID=A0ABN6FD98_9BACT|nr:LysR family transcriptional regulator [Desulfoluna limicola]BCS99148.1 LysR family transcriptional regulator [Desulfoluna limicola]